VEQEAVNNTKLWGGQRGIQSCDVTVNVDGDVNMEKSVGMISISLASLVSVADIGDFQHHNRASVRVEEVLVRLPCACSIAEQRCLRLPSLQQLMERPYRDSLRVLRVFADRFHNVPQKRRCIQLYSLFARMSPDRVSRFVGAEAVPAPPPTSTLQYI